MSFLGSDLNLAIPYYSLLELLGDSLNASVYKAAAKENPDSLFIIKLLKRPVSSENQRRYLAQKVERLKIIHDPRVITAHSFDCSSTLSLL